MGKKRMTHSASFKAKVALAAIKQDKTASQLGSQFKVHPTVIAKWKAKLLDQAAEIFTDGRARCNDFGRKTIPASTSFIKRSVGSKWSLTGCRVR